MEIVLIRHGKPTGAIYPRVNAKGFYHWVKAYDDAGIMLDSQPENNFASTFNDYYLVSSDLKRAIESAHIGFNKRPSETFNVLREITIPHYNLPFTLKTSTWLYLNRVLWTLGIKGSSESYSAAKKRAITASKQLIKLAVEHDKVVVVSHGYLNFFIRRYLLKQGWCLKEKSSCYWGITRLKS